ncbi:hypothetical protein BHU72_02020 [Desulfuribacillus stibiiarsenatis]|uniref:Response regulatory domain-containing protein n=1 Tax=Desulfuribacillus stibiiarsenatis TaxID=1390249 RepID=A0A1E5L705_9FIRM|nr:hypothetical protein BHU72_02020 [Desulfuribacillus stibiiarsenatis]
MIILGEWLLNSPLILVVEDNVSNLVLATRLLEKQGWNVLSVDNGEKAVEIYQQHDFHAILMDVQMPIMDGYQATRKIREIEKTTGRRTTIIALTAFAMRSDREKCLEAGMDDYLTKPIIVDDFFSKMKHYLES